MQVEDNELCLFYFSAAPVLSLLLALERVLLIRAEQ